MVTLVIFDVEYPKQLPSSHQSFFSTEDENCLTLITCMQYE